ncbi:acetolactate synthase small subunit [ANME-2 cluster archaeon]|nr:acetolactate synthase small subunit [Methanosarcinales archaeon]RJS72454.1 MAG: acetolactate synthase small subunit [ANME-2 cluster archaeon]RLG25476.1 MAG: acetolactate synthase small subunit [Methanosarcinales archaeon]
MRHILAVLVDNKPGVLARVSGLFSRRGFNIESLAVGTAENPEISRMTIVVRGDDRVLAQVMSQLGKLIDVISVSDLPSSESVDRELVLIKVAADAGTRSEIMQIANIFRAKIIDVGAETLIIEVTGDEGKVKAIEDMLARFGIKELVRTGIIAMNRGTKMVKGGYT